MDSTPTSKGDLWAVLATSLVNNSIASSPGDQIQEDIVSTVTKSLRVKGNLISSLISELNSARNIGEIKEKLEEIDNYERTLSKTNTISDHKKDMSTHTSTQEKALSKPQLCELKKNISLFREIEWKNSLFQDWLIQEDMLSDDGRISIDGKHSECQQHWAIFLLVLSRSATDIFDKLVPIFEEVGYADLAELINGIKKIKDDGESFSVSDIMHLMNPRRIADALYRNKAIKEDMFADLISPYISRGEKIRKLRTEVERNKFLQALREKYPHFYGLFPNTKPEETPDTLEDYATTDIARLSDFSDDASSQTERDLEPTPLEPTHAPYPSWCCCGRCRKMTNKEDQLCCTQKKGVDCFGYGKVVDALIALANWFKSKTSMPESKWRSNICRNMHHVYENRAEFHRQLRQRLDREISILRDGRTGPGQRKRIPSCCIWKVRDAFPDPTQHYTGFRESRVTKNVLTEPDKIKSPLKNLAKIDKEIPSHLENTWTVERREGQDFQISV